MKLLRKALDKYLDQRHYLGTKKMFRKYYNKMISSEGFSFKAIDKKIFKIWEKKWSVFGHKPSDISYKIYSSYIGNNENIVPNEIARTFIEPVLTPYEFQPFYNDKNSFNIFLKSEWLPKVYFRSIDDKNYDGDYKPFKIKGLQDYLSSLNVDSLVIKPSRGMGGSGVELFFRDKENFFNSKGDLLDVNYLNNKYKTNYLIQECLKQSPFFSQFNESSINTLRVATYRHIVDGEIIVLGVILRIGGKGSFVDNVSSGGFFVSVDKTGRLDKKVIDKTGLIKTKYNNIDFEKSNFIVPNFEKIISFVKEIAYKMPHMSLFASDVAVDMDGNPKLLEVNTMQFSYRLYQVTSGPVFGRYTDEIIEYCKHFKN